MPINAQGRERFTLFPVPDHILSSYSDRPLVQLSCGKGAPDAIDDLEALIAECPWLRVTDLWRDPAIQGAARKKYEAWVAAGKPPPNSAAFNAKTMKAAFVALPGKSMHGPGSATDLDTGAMQKALGAQYLDEFWPIAARHGFPPVIAKPTEGAAESWHFDYKGLWQPVFDTLGYEQGVLAANCAFGTAGPFQSSERRVQAHIVRLSAGAKIASIGEIDGNLGPRSRTALVELGIDRALVDATKPTATRIQAMTNVAELLEQV